MRKTIQQLAILGIVMVLVGMTACSQKRKPLVPLLLDSEVKAQAAALTEQGTQAYQARQFEEARRYFEQAVTAAPQSGPAARFGMVVAAPGHGKRLACGRAHRSRIRGSIRP